MGSRTDSPLTWAASTTGSGLVFVRLEIGVDGVIGIRRFISENDETVFGV